MKIPVLQEGLQKKFFRKNFALLVEKNPFFTFFSFSEKEKPILTQKGWNLKKKNRFFYTEKELDSFAMPEEGTEVLFFYGLGLGYPFFFLEEWLKKSPQKKLHFIEEDKEVFSAFLQTSWAEKVLRHPQVKISYVEKTKKLFPFLQELIENYAPLHPSLQVASFYHSKSKERVIGEVKKEALLKKAYYLEKIHSHQLFSNLVKNSSFLNQSSYLNAWEKAFEGVPAIIGGAGPSSVLIQEKLKDSYDRALILAGGAATASFSRQEIGFHLAVAIDPNPEEEKLFKQSLKRNIPLIYTLRTCPEAVALMEGPLIYAKMAYISEMEKWLQKRRKLFHEAIGKKLSHKALSVTCFSVAIAQFLGCNPIILAGVDLSYEKTPYAAGVVATQKEETFAFAKKPFLAKGKKEVFTNLFWKLEEEALSNFAKKYPETLFLDASDSGLIFSAIKHRPFGQIFEKYLTKTYPIEKKINALIKEAKIAEKKSDLALIQQSLLRIKKLLKVIEKNCTSKGEIKGRGVLAEIELKEEIAYRFLFSDSLYYFSKMLKKEEPKQKKWQLFQVLVEKHLEALQN